MRKVILYSILLVIGLVGSQTLPSLLGPAFEAWETPIRLGTMIALAFIMIHVGYEFDIDKSNLGQYGWDYVVAMTAAAFPWIFVTAYFIFILLPMSMWGSWDAWKESLLAGRFAAPTSAGVLFSMLAAAGLAGTWVFRKARILAIFDDLDTVLLMIPLKMLMVGLAWQLGIIVVLMAAMLLIAWVWLHKVRIPLTWPWVLTYAGVIGIGSEIIYRSSKIIDDSVPIHIEVLLPAFVLGCIIARPRQSEARIDEQHHHDEVLERPTEVRAATIIASVFMVLVGLSMPFIFGGDEPAPVAVGSPSAAEEAVTSSSGSVLADQPMLGWGAIALHVLLITVVSNLGKMFPAFCYRREAHWRERLAVAIGMWPRGEVGAGVLVISLSYGIGGPIVIIAMLSLGLNLLLTGVFILIVKYLIATVPTESDEEQGMAVNASA